jgi:hypothetical protein
MDFVLNPRMNVSKNQKKNALRNIVALKELVLPQWNYVQLILIVARTKLSAGMERVLMT